MNTMIFMFHMNFKSFEANEDLILDCNDVNREFLCHITHKDDKVFDFDITAVDQKIYYVAMNKIVKMTFKNNIAFVCTFLC